MSGGGVISGIAIAAKHLKPPIEVVGVEVKLYPSMFAAHFTDLAASKPVTEGEAIVPDRTAAIASPTASKALVSLVA